MWNNILFFLIFSLFIPLLPLINIFYLNKTIVKSSIRFDIIHK